jgi:hypothetical protein
MRHLARNPVWTAQLAAALVGGHKLFSKKLALRMRNEPILRLRMAWSLTSIWWSHAAVVIILV